MRPEERDISYLWDMRQAAREIIEFVLGVPYDLFEKDKKLRYAVERQLIVIGEAAAHVSAEFQELHSEIPWNQIIGQRNVLAHEYGEILVERIWLTATKSLPELLNHLEKLVPEEDEKD
ncbi:MAG TPA: HepT-like ribonuclease domain-containing protein [Anaerolineaceae bacterium]